MAEQKQPTWEEKLAQMRDELEYMVTVLNKDQQYEAAAHCQAALQVVAGINDKIVWDLADVSWRGPTGEASA